MTGIFSRFIIYDSICDFIIIDILHSSFHSIPEFSLRDFLCVSDIFGFGTFLDRNICIFLTNNLVEIQLLFFDHVPEKVITYVNVVGTHVYLPIIC